MNRRLMLLSCAAATAALFALVAAVRPLDSRSDAAGPPGPARPLRPVADGDTVFGHGAALDEQLAKAGRLSPDGFAKRFPPSDYLTKLSFDPTTAAFFKEFNAAKPPAGSSFALDDAEMAAFKKNGFVASERLGAASFSQMLYRVYSRDLPVYLSADAALHAWHRSYDAMLEELEETYLSVTLQEMLDAMAAGAPALRKEVAGGPLADAVTDADYFLAVARSLLTGAAVKSELGQDERVAKTLAACDGLKMQTIDLFGRDRVTDFSQLKPRGHYENSDLLRRYFRAMMWCGRIDLRVAGDPEHASPRELGAAVVLHELLRRGGKFDRWREADRLLQTFVGRTDSMTFDQLGGLLASAGIDGPKDVNTAAALEALQKRILAGKLGTQRIGSDHYVSPFGPEKVSLPRSFTVMGQRFTLDSWATGEVVYDRILWDGKKVQRRIPSGLDVAFAALGNDAAVPALVDRMKDTGGRKFRDGLPYQHRLAAVRGVIDSQDKAAWDENLYTGWLGTLRELSRPTTGKGFPEAARTEAWAMKGLNTQLASWAQLRHDTILHVKQSYTMTTMCYYPAGYVEPVPLFWERFEKMANRAASRLEKTPFPDVKVTKTIAGPRGKDFKLPVSVKGVQARQVAHFRNFAKQLGELRKIAIKQAAQEELTKEQTLFLRKTVEIEHRGSGGPRYNGWYFGLFYNGHEDADKWDALVADVHTDVADDTVGDPGCVLHQGVGGVDFLLVAIDNGKDRMVYGGPVLSHYEFEMPGTERMADSEWRKRLREGKQPPRPAWTRVYLVPGANPAVKTYEHVNDE